MKINFYKYHGTGNDFIMIDDRFHELDKLRVRDIQLMCHRRFGIGADGLILLRNHEQYNFEMIYYNSDGNISSMCGNGGRCIVQFARDLDLIKEECTFLAIDGPHEAKILDGEVRLKMKDVTTIESGEGFYILDTGSPHYVKLVEDVDKVDIIPDAQKIRYNDRYRQNGINVNFIKIKNDNTLDIRTYERGVEDETYSCGTGVVAAAIAASEAKKTHAETFGIFTKGGQLSVSFKRAGHQYSDIWLCGPATFVFSGGYEVKP